MARARTYRSPRRDRQAEETRQQILAAARRLFSEGGYTATTVGDIASGAGVSVPTVYASVGTKAQLALALVEFINREADMDALVAAQDAATTAEALLDAFAHLTRQLHERCGDIIRSLLSAATSSTELRPASDEGRRVHRDGCHQIAARLAAMDALTPHLDVAQAGAVLATYAGPEAVERFTVEHEWTFDELEAFLAHAMRRLLLDE